MNTALMALMTASVQLHGFQRLLLLIPLCLSISLVYKTTRCERLGDIPLATLALWATIVGGMVGVGGFMWLAFMLLA